MICKKIALWGKSGSGKTTLAVNLALALAERNALVGLVSANLLYADIQAFFGQTVYPDKGIFNAMKDSTASVLDMFWKCGLHDNLFLLSVPNSYSGLDADGVTLNMAEKLYAGCDIHFDYLLIDGREDILNPISSVGLTQAEEILTLYRPSVASSLWHKAMEQFCEQLHLRERMTPILNAEQNDCADFAATSGLSFAYQLPYVQMAQTAANQGKPLYLVNDKAAKRYARVVDEIADKIYSGR